MSVLAPVVVTGNTAVVVASEGRPLPAVSLTEVLATSDVPGGVRRIHGSSRVPVPAVVVMPASSYRSAARLWLD